ncbi:SusD/RagB family nutrient-binding outer membrane lipoprotein [Flavitalea antarctica]
MKFNKILLSLSIVATAFSSCKKQWLDINTNPNQLPIATPNYVFTSGANRTAGTIGPNELGSYWSGQWTQSNTYIISGSQFQYIFNNTNFNYWDNWYDILNDFQFVIDNADEQGQPFMKGPAKVMKAYIYQQLVDVYGNIPYRDALKGTGSLTPKFDDQKFIYEDLIKVLDTAITDLRANAFTAVGSSSDIIMKGNTANWIRFANSLKLRILMRQTRVAGRAPYIIAEINKAAAAPEGFLAAGFDVTSNPGYVGSEGKTNPIYNQWGYTATGTTQALGRYPRPTEFLFQQMISTGDTFRLKKMFYAVGGESSTPGVSVNAEVMSNYKAVPFGASSGYLSQNTSPLGPSVIQRGQFNKSVVLFEAAESFFLLAEAKERYAAGVTLTGTAQSYYEQGVRESFRYTGTASTAATTLLTSGKDLADYTASPDKLKAIWQQKWLALANIGGFEAWAEYRKNNFPAIPKSASAAANAVAPVRLYYPQGEEASNGVNVKEQGTINVFTSRLFWDVD